MAKKVASLYAEIGADTSGLERGLKQTKDGLKESEKGFSSFKSAILPVSAALVGAGLSAQQAYQFISEGADLELAEMRFSRLATSIGTTADTLNNDLSKATSGLLSQADQMSLAGDLMSLGLAKTREEAVRLTSVAAQLGMNMNQLVLTLTNQTTMRFDALGVAVDGFDDKITALEEQGYSTDEAFKWAFIEQAEAQIERVGGVADTTAGELMKLEAGIANLKDEAKKSAATFAGPFISKINDSREALNLLNQGYESGAISVSDYIGMQVRLRVPLTDVSYSLEYINDQLDAYNSIGERAYDISYQFAQSTGVTSEGLNWYAQRAQEAGERNAAFATSMERVQSTTDTATQSLTVAGQAYSSISTSVWSTTQALQDQIDFLSAGGGALLVLASTAKEALDEENFKGAQEALDAAAVGAVDLDLELGKIDTDEAVERLMELGLGPEEATAKVKELQDSIFALTAQQYTIRFNLETSGGYIKGSNITAPGYTGGSGTKPSDAEGQSAGFGPAGSGAVVQILGPIYVQDGSDFFAYMANAAQRGQRQSAGVNAGSLYTGAA